MTRQRHYHPLAALRFLRKAVVVCLLPLANALLEFSLNALLTALRQDAALLLFLCGASSILLEASSWALDEAGVLRLRWAFLSKQERIIRGEALAALTIERPLFFRLLGASRVVLYPVGQPAKRAVTLYLHKEDAQELADRLMPVRDPVCHRPAGGERAALVVLGANGLSTLALTYLAIRQSRPFPLTAEAVALSRLNVLVRFAAHWPRPAPGAQPPASPPVRRGCWCWPGCSSASVWPAVWPRPSIIRSGTLPTSWAAGAAGCPGSSSGCGAVR